MGGASTYLNRFGYGLRWRGQTGPGAGGTGKAPEAALLAEIDRFDPAPSAIAGREDTSGRAGEIFELLRRNRMMRQRQGPPAAAAGMMPGAMAAEDGAVRGPLADLPPEIRRAYLDGGRVLRRDIAIKVNTAARSDTPFAERLVHFWSNHFSVSAGKPGTQHQVGNHEFGVIRRHVFGRFSDLLKAAVLHPAMLLYLDQFQSVGPSSLALRRGWRRGGGGPGGRERGLNENLAREILELHTLGVAGGYDQADVTEFARALTGWTIAGLGRIARFAEPQANGAAFVAVAHEPGARRIMGRTYREGGPEQALAVLDDLAAHPATARHVAVKLARHFAGDTPPETLIARLEADFRRTGGDLESLSRTLVASPETWAAGPVKYRAPFEWLVAVLRLTGIEDLDDNRLAGALRELGQLPWRAPSPAGYDDLEGSWAGPDALVRRVELAERVARNVPAGDVMARAEAAFPGALSENTRIWLSRAESGTQALGLLLVAPEMMRR
ncbi:DUF1800 family protein [Erythrobacter sp. HL-111]|uniref:DUF1800 domain-containing protein n=1 Tax=Erythrobacter sp. HL-111 TaxID=1798193 RepID=UPI00087BCAEB|nr:DUF1800 domain-containing protein [Erythrobacter sp. HL-111]SDR73227.1 Uncharacterized conserved protein, DUF1800 family [Erythrobacter sp. HL-111]